ncbi:hypothetical protein ONS95_000562 [Cadophora gregata]|uniref:uncharacterized protein n=1 Tax=Cadophora gregata TaxID=51156 RepID=UPI0026DC8AF6|nr:uncharacterized protein ONS95_000562 [Cadophora gregata]KAK0125422.1 hypothetical protein ONS96_009265 [Cadophora gregata f. sp. sojae]KAK0128598.1 hypothetical protein ONS95_000562 [Cadophora gregata]
MRPSFKTIKTTRAIKNAKKVKIDPILVAISPISEQNRATLEDAKVVLESPNCPNEDRALVLSYLKEIYNAAEDHRTLYHFLCACYLLSVYSTENLATRKMYATKVETESKKQIKKLTLHMDKADNEFRVSIQIYEGLKNMAIKSSDRIGQEVRKALAEGKSIGEVKKDGSGEEEETRHVKKKKRVLWGRVEKYSDDEEERDGGRGDGQDDHEENTAVEEVRADADEYQEEQSEGEEESEDEDEEEE